MSKTLLAVNTLTAVGSQAYSSHLNLAFRMGKESEDEFLLFTGWRCSIDRFRNEAGKIALRQECDYLMFLDDDVLVPRDTYGLLKSRMTPGVDVVTPVVYIRSYPFKPMFFKSIQDADNRVGLTHYDDWKEVMEESKETLRNGLLPVAAIGFSCCLLRVELLKKVQPAWFVTGSGHTEDVYFCVKVKQATNNAAGIYVDTHIDAGHVLDPEFVSTKTRESLQKMYEDMFPELKHETHGDHQKSYLKDNEAALEKSSVITLKDGEIRLNEMR